MAWRAVVRVPWLGRVLETSANRGFASHESTESAGETGGVKTDTL